MNKYHTVFIAVEVLLLTAAVLPSALFGDGAGGAYWGSQQNAYPWESQDDPGFSSTADRLDYVGGMGYGIEHDGRVAGGFGIGFTQNGEEEQGLSCGFGGVISGYRIFQDPLNVLALIYAGVGGVTDDASEDPRLREGSFAVYGEATLEASLPLTFFHPTIYAGYQVIASVGEGGLGDAFLSYSPTVGVRILWGDQ